MREAGLLLQLLLELMVIISVKVNQSCQLPSNNLLST
jgi:hypothetical protein